MSTSNYIMAQNQADTFMGWSDATEVVDNFRHGGHFPESIKSYQDFLTKDAERFDIEVDPKRAKQVRRWYKRLKAFDPILQRKLLPFRTALGVLSDEIWQDNLAIAPWEQILEHPNELKPSAALRAQCCMLVVRAIFTQAEELHLIPEEYNFDYLCTKRLSAAEEAWYQRGPGAYLLLLGEDEGKDWTANLIEYGTAKDTVERIKLNFDVRTRNIFALQEERLAQPN